MEATKSANPRYVAALALVAGIILLVGWLVRPREIPTAPAAVPSETELQQLARRAQRRQLENTSDYFRTIAREAAASLVPVAATQTTGVTWDDGRVVAAATHDASTEGLREPFFITAAPEARATMRRADAMPNTGAWVVAVWRIGTQHAHMIGTFGQVTSTICGGTTVREVITSMHFTPSMTGGGLFDLDGGLIAVMVACEQRIVAITAASVDAMLRIEESEPIRLFRRFGVMLAEFPDDAKAYFGDISGLVVTEIWNGSLADLAGLYAGDVITAMNGTPISQRSHLTSMANLSASPLEIQARRGQRRLQRTLSAHLVGGQNAKASAGVRWEAAPRGFAIAKVEPGTRAAGAGLQPGDRILRVDYAVPRNVAHIDRLFADAERQLTLLEVDRGNRRVAVFLK